MRKYIGVVSIVLFVVVLGIISFTFFAKKDDEITQTTFLRKVSSNLEYPIVNNEEELLEILKNQNYQNETCDCIQDYEIKVENKTYIIYDLEEGMRVRLDEKEAVLSSEDSNKLSQIIQETMR